jgi:hypothetical protein
MLESMGRGVLRMVFKFEKQRSGGDLLLGIRCRWIDNEYATKDFNVATVSSKTLHRTIADDGQTT